MAEENRNDVENTVRGSAPRNGAAAASQVSAEERAHRAARRRILAGGLAGAPLVLTLSSRSAFASHCSASAMQSGNMSTTHDVECLGRTPGYWKTHELQSSRYIYVGTCNPISDDNGQCDDYSFPDPEDLTTYIDQMSLQGRKNDQKLAAAQEYLDQLETFPEPTSFFGTPFSEIFGEGCTTDPDVTMMQALWLDDTPPMPPEGVGGPSPVLAHSAAAWLNANEFGKEAYGLSPEEVVALVQSMILTDPIGLKENLEMMNSRG